MVRNEDTFFTKDNLKINQLLPQLRKSLVPAAD